MSSASSVPKRLSRAESFLGIHFDFHARELNIPVGRNTTPEMVEKIIHNVRPDYIQCDCKGHHGLSSYPTKVGNAAPVVVGDPLRVWRDVTAANGVALYVHYSGLFDEKALQLHPEWARIDENGNPDRRAVSIYSPYLEELMIPQLKELIDDYQIDGVWVDGDCWVAARDYSPAALRAFQLETGIETVPRTPKDAHYAQLTEFSRESYRKYLRSYVDQLHAHDPHLQIASNWAFSTFMPEPVSANVDFLSGDSAPVFGSFPRLEARCMAHQGTPWDIMTWSFGGRFSLEGTSPVGMKSAAQLEQEAATILAFGAGYQSVSNQRLDGSVIEWHLEVMAEVAEFCRQRQALCHRGQLIPQIALVHAGTAYYEQVEPLFISIGLVNDLIGVLEGLLGSQNVVDVVMPHQLSGRMDEYPLIVIPDWQHLPAGFKDQVLERVGKGGNLLLIGPGPVRLFENELDVTLQGDALEEAVKFVEHDGQLNGHRAGYQPVKLGDQAVQFGRLFDDFGGSSAASTAASITPYGQGRIGAIYFSFGDYYHKATTPIARRFLNSLVRELFPEPMVEVIGSESVDVVLTRKGNKLIVHLINMGGQHDNARVQIFDEISRPGPLQVVLRLGHKPKHLTLEPGGTQLPFSYGDGVLRLTVPQLDIHQMVVAEA